MQDFVFANRSGQQRTFYSIINNSALIYSSEPVIWAILEKELKLAPQRATYFMGSVSSKAWLVSKSILEDLQKRYIGRVFNIVEEVI